MRWRWDQGRLDYFHFDAICQIASALIELEPVDLNPPGAFDPLRETLQHKTGLPFSPARYKVWRNYARVFKAELLAANIETRLVCTELCRHIADPMDAVVDVDEYLGFLAPRFYFPSPAFQDYDSNADPSFPFCVILKILLSKVNAAGNISVSADEVITLGIANGLSGFEGIAEYRSLRPAKYEAGSDERRQIREMLRFLSQFSFLKWQASKLYLDIDKVTTSIFQQIEVMATPIMGSREPDADREVLRLGAFTQHDVPTVDISERIYNEDEVFTEGKKVRVTHLRSERSRKLRGMFFRRKRPPYVCDMCELNVSTRYPWTDNILDVHHLLPLASPIHVDVRETSLRDLVGLCPTCHRATHAFYRDWLNRNNSPDFQSHEQARHVYSLARESLC